MPVSYSAHSNHRFKEDKVTQFYNYEDRAHLGDLHRHAKPEYDAFLKLNQTAFGRTDGEISPLNRELIAIAVAVSRQCPFCIQTHTKNARAHGASDAAVAEATMIAVAIGAGSAAVHGALAMKLFGEASPSV